MQSIPQSSLVSPETELLDDCGESLVSNLSNIFNNQKKLLSSQVLFVKNNLEMNRIIDFYLKGKKNYFFKSNSDEQFIKRYYINKSNLIDKAVLKIIRDCND